jgi:hypothetical protein
MTKITNKEITQYIVSNIQSFHSSRLENLKKLKLGNVLKRKNPYLFKAKNINTAELFVRNILDAHLSSQEEGIFGGFLEELAIFICGKVFDGKKSSAEGIDLEFEKERIKYIVSIKSGPNWGNSRQIAKMKDDFKRAKKVLGTNVGIRNVVSVNGCCYGKDNNPDKGDYLKLCGQEFWMFISDNGRLYIDIIEPLGHEAKQRNEEFNNSYDEVVNKFTFEFIQNFCENGKIKWDKIVKYNSGKKDD